MPHLTIIVVVLVVCALLAAAAWFGKDELGEAGEALWTAWCYVFLLGWRIRLKLRNVFAQSALVVLLVTSCYLSIEFALTLVQKFGSTLPNNVVGRSSVPFPEVSEIPLPYEIASLILALLTSVHHWKEWKISRRQSAVPRAVEGLLLQSDQFLRDGAKKDTAKKSAHFEQFMEKIKALMDTKSDRDVAISIMEREAKEDAPLAVTFIHPATAPIDKEFKVLVGKGVAGKAYEKRAPVYVPSARHFVGINGETLRSEGLTYVPSEDKKTFRSLLSVPVIVGTDVFAVLTFSSRKRSAFDPEDFEIARLAAAFVAMFY